MEVCSLEFLVAVLLAAIIYPWIPSTRFRQLLFSIASFAFLYVTIPDIQSGMVLASFIFTGFAATRILRVTRSRSLLWGFVTLQVVAFLFLKKYAFLTLLFPESVLSSTISTIGLSYLLFRIIHVAVDAYQGQLEDLSLWSYVNYNVNLFGFVSGPIQRYPDFQNDWRSLTTLHADFRSVHNCYRRLFFGMIKLSFVSPKLLDIHDAVFNTILENPSQTRMQYVIGFLVILYVYPFFVYINFSGYCDIVISASRLFGMTMPENFNSPFLSRNMIEYWTRWHITLGTWIRDYVFLPIYKPLTTRWPRHSAIWAVACYFISLVVAGVWHGASWNFVVFGLLNGLGVSVAKLWEMLIVAMRGRSGLKAYLGSTTNRVVAVFVTFHYVCFSDLFFHADFARTVAIIVRFVSVVFGLKTS